MAPIDLTPFRLADGTLRQTTRRENRAIVYTTDKGTTLCCGCADRNGVIIVSAGMHTGEEPCYCAVCADTLTR